MDFFDFVPIPAIAVIVEFIALVYKTKTSADNKWLPIICLGAGAILGVVAWVVYPAIYPADDAFTAIAIGLASGAIPIAGYEAISAVKTNNKG